MSEFYPDHFNEFENNDTAYTGSDASSPVEEESVYHTENSDVSQDTSESHYFNHLHQEDIDTASDAPDSTYHYSYGHGEGAGADAASGAPDSTYHYSYGHSENASQIPPSENVFHSSKKKKYTRKQNGKKSHPIARLIASALVFGLVAGAAFQGFNYCYYKVNPDAAAGSTIERTPVLQTGNGTVKTTTDLSEMVANVMPSIVSITSVVEQQINYGFWGYRGGTQEAEGAGSGIIISKNNSELLIVTNYHVIENAKKISVAFCDSKDVEATVKGSDRDADLAVVSVPLNQMEASTKNAIKLATLGKSGSLKVGEPAIAIGNALGYGQSVTAGYVSALDREVALTDKTMTLLQTDAAINPGNSGGALLNMKGEVIGINTVKYSDTTVEGMGYAIPIDIASPIIESLMTQETIPEGQQAYLGITGSDVTESYSNQLNLPTGIYVQSVQEGSPAEQGGLYAGDVIVKFEGNSVSTMESLINKLSRKKSGEQIKLGVKRMNQQGTFEDKELTITLGSKKDM